jgi:DNA-binding response OmpR family regulator
MIWRASSRSASTSSGTDGRRYIRFVRVLLAADADWLVDDLVAALGGPDVSFTVCSEGRKVSRIVAERAVRDEPFDIAIVDLQIGSMGGMAVTLALRLDESAGMVPHVPVVMLLDRVADVHLARRSGTDGWLVKPLDPLRLDRAVRTVLAGGRYREGLDGLEVLAAAPVPVTTAEGEVRATDASE